MSEIILHRAPPPIHSTPGVICSPFDPTHRKFARGAVPSSRAALSKAPRHLSRLTGAPLNYWLPKILSMWLNDVDGDCVTAFHAFLRACMGILIQDATVKTWASKNGVLNGADLTQVNQLMQTAGFQQEGNTYNEGPAVVVDFTSGDNLMSALGVAPVQLGIDANALPSGAGNNNGWYAFGGSPGSFSNEDHCVGVPGFAKAVNVTQLLQAMIQQYGNIGNIPWPSGDIFLLYTWMTIGFVDLPWINSCAGEAWMSHPGVIIVGSGTPSPDSVLTPTPVPPPPPTPPGPGPGPTPAPSGGTYALTTNSDGSLLFTPSSAGPIQITPATTVQDLIDAMGNGPIPNPTPAPTIVIPPIIVNLLKILCPMASFIALINATLGSILATICGLVPHGIKNAQGGLAIPLSADLASKIAAFKATERVAAPSAPPELNQFEDWLRGLSDCPSCS